MDAQVTAKEIAARHKGNGSVPAQRIPKAWLDFMWFCFNLHHGEIERLKIQDGLPVLAELTKKKIKFAP